MVDKSIKENIEAIDVNISGTIEVVSKEDQHIICCYFVHPDPQHKINEIESEFVANNLEQTKDESIRLLIAKINTETQTTETYPVILYYDSPNFLKPKYEDITTIVFKGYSLECGKAINDMDILYGLPNNIDNIFQKTLLNGLGFRQAYNFIPNMINAQKLGVQKIIFSKTDKTRILQDKSMIISQPDLITLRQGINRIGNEKSREKTNESCAFVYNTIFNKYEPSKFPAMRIKRKLSVVFRQFKNTDIDSSSLSLEDKKSLVSSKTAIDFTYFNSLYTEFQKLLTKKTTEETYQKFFNDNPLILTVITGLPYYLFHEKAYVGGKTINNRNGEITDFLLKHSTIANTAIVEIKTPKTPLLNKTLYRDGVFGASKELSGAIAQVLTQRSSLMKFESDIKGSEDFHVYNPQGFLIIGYLDELNSDEKRRSFELFRLSQKDVKIITYDECLTLLKILVDALSQ